MGTNRSLLCIHRDPAQLSWLAQSGYERLTATGHDGLRLFMSRPVDAIVPDYHLGHPRLRGRGGSDQPWFMYAEDAELPDEAFKTVDALVAKSEGPHSLLATVRSLLNGRLAQPGERKARSQTLTRAVVPTSGGRVERRRASATQLSTEEKDAPFSPAEWRSIRSGTFRF
jgi:hypothetical protein